MDALARAKAVIRDNLKTTSTVLVETNAASAVKSRLANIKSNFNGFA